MADNGFETGSDSLNERLNRIFSSNFSSSSPLPVDDGTPPPSKAPPPPPPPSPPPPTPSPHSEPPAQRNDIVAPSGPIQPAITSVKMKALLKSVEARSKWKASASVSTRKTTVLVFKKTKKGYTLKKQQQDRLIFAVTGVKTYLE